MNRPPVVPLPGPRSPVLRAGRIALIAGVAALGSFAYAAPKAVEKTLTDAKKAVKAGRTAEAIAGFKAFVAAAPADERAPWALTQAGDLEARAGRTADAIGTYTDVVQRYPRSPDARVAKANLTALSGSVMGAARAKLEGAKTEEERLAALWAVGEAHEQGGDPAKAAAAYRDVKTSTRSATWRRKAAAKLDAMVEERLAAAAGKPPDEGRLRQIAELAEAAEQWERATEYHLRSGAAAGDTAGALRARLNAARALTLGRRPARAHVLYEEVRKASPPPDIAEDAARAEGLLHEDQRQYADAVETYEAYLAAAGTGEDTVWARRRRAWCLERAGRIDAALSAYQEMAVKWPKHVAAAESLLAIGRIAEARREYEAARVSYTRCAEDFAGTTRGDEARERLAGLPRRIAEWERTKAEISRMAESYARRERRAE